MSERPQDDRTGRAAADADRGDSPPEVLAKLEALLGRMRSADAPAEAAGTQAAIPTLTDPVLWASPAPSLEPLPLRGHIPTLTEAVELLSFPDNADTRPAAPDLDPGPGSNDPAQPQSAAPPAPHTRAVSDDASRPSAEALRERVHALLDPALERRLAERTLSELDRTLVDLQHDFKQNLAVWREEQADRIREQVRGEVERAIDEVVDAIVRQQNAAPD